MSYKNKFIYLSLILTMFSTNSFANPPKYDHELVVSGSDILERIDGNIEVEGKDHGREEGKKVNSGAVYVDGGATVENLGNITGGKHKYKTTLGGLVFAGIDNEVKKTDSLITLKSNPNSSKITNFNNYGDIKLEGIEQDIEIISIAGLIPTEMYYADYFRNVIDSSYSNIYNNGNITMGGDKNNYFAILEVSALKAPYRAYYYKKVINMEGGSLINDGNIIAERDNQLILKDGLSVELIKLGVYYNVYTTGVSATNSTITNKGNIFIGGDTYNKKKFSGITVDGLGADLVGVHEKYGTQLFGGKFTNMGTIEVERDYKYDVNGNVLILTIGVGGILDVQLLNFGNRKEISVGAELRDGANFTNLGGTIKVGANNGGAGASGIGGLLSKSSAVAFLAYDSTVDFNSGKIELEGSNVLVGQLRNSTMTFRDESEVIYKTKDGEKLTVNKDIFDNDSSSNYYIKGNLKISGYEDSLSGVDKDGNPVYVEGGEFEGDLHIGSKDNLYIGVYEDKNGNIVYDETGKAKLGNIYATGKITADGKIKILGSDLVGKDLSQFNGNKLITAEKGLGGNNPVSSDAGYMFTVDTEIKSDENGDNVIISGINGIQRKDFRNIVENSDLGKLFETYYEGANEEQLEVYKILAQGEDAQDFANIVDEVTGKDTITTLTAQVYDITKDMNKQFKDFAKNSTQDGVVFKYINSDSELEADSSTVGFERESSGIMVGYNNNLNEKLRLGLGFSYMDSDIDYTSNSSNKIKTWSVRGYADYNLNFANLFTDLSLGYNKSDNKRFAEQLAYTGIKEGDLKVYTLSLNNSLYREYKFGDKLSFTPSLNLDFTYLSQDDFKESGTLGAEADKVEAFYITGGVSGDIKYNLMTFGNSKINLLAGMDYSYDMLSDSEDMNLRVSAFDPYYKEDLRELDKKSLTYDIGANFEYKDSYSLGVKYTKELINNVDNDQIGVDVTYKF